MEPIDQDPDFKRFCRDLDALRGRVALHRPSPDLVQRILKTLPPKPVPVARKMGGWGILTPVFAAGMVASLLFFAGENWQGPVMRRLSLRSSRRESSVLSFSRREWRLVDANVPRNLPMNRRVQAAELVALWNRQGLPIAWWQPVLQQAAQRNRLGDVLSLCQLTDREHMSNRRLMVVLGNELPAQRSKEAIWTEMRTLTQLAAKEPNLSIDGKPTLEASLPPSLERKN